MIKPVASALQFTWKVQRGGCSLYWSSVAGRSVLKGCAAAQSESFSSQILCYSEQLVQICISKRKIWSRTRYFVIDSDPKKKALLFCVTPETFFRVWGMYLCLVLSLYCIGLASGSVNIQEAHKRSSYLCSHAWSKKKYSFYWITQMHCLSLVLTNCN